MNHQDCIFCKLVNNEIPSMKVFEDDKVIAFLDINPIANGHTVVINKQHSQDLTSSSDEMLTNMIVAMKKVSNILKDKLGVEQFNYLSNQGRDAGQVIDHWHFHVIPKYDQAQGFIANHNIVNLQDIATVFKKIKG